LDVLLPLGSIEKHGPHLPLDTDTVMARALAERVAEPLRASVAPAFTRTACSFAADFPGTVSVPAEEEQQRLAEVVRDLLREGAGRIVLVNLHFDPEHMRAVRAVVAAERRLVFPDFTRRANAQRIGGEFATGACHAGEFETSIMLAVAPEAVREFRALPARDVNLALAIREGKRSFRELGLDQAYCGHPATATAKEGERVLGVLTELVRHEFGS
jgi:creatinine amidohydrolase